MRSKLGKVLLVLCLGVLAGCPLVGATKATAQGPLPAAWVAPAISVQESGSEADRIAALEKKLNDQTAAIASAQTAGDNAWMLTAAALVLLMTGPGLALFYGGLVRKKNVLGTMMQSFAMMRVVTVLWAVVTYSAGIWQWERVYRRACTICFCTGWGCRRARTRRRFRCRRSWCIS